jgi:HD-like signal output (HDOD) protein
VLTELSQDKNKTTIRLSQQETFERIFEGLEKIGDLPIFSASVNRIHLMSSNEETELMELATEIMKDANLTAKLLRVSNSSYYSRGTSKIAVVSRAIIVLGYNTVKSITLTMKVIDSFKYDHPSIDLNSFLIKSYMSAGFVRDLAIKAGVRDPEESYVCALLHTIGEILVAAILTDEYLQISQLVKSENVVWSKAQQKVLGTNFSKIGQEVLKKWEFPSSTINTLTPFNRTKDGRIKDKIQLNRALASFSSNIMDCLYSPSAGAEQDYNEILHDLSKVTGLKHDALTSSLNNSFKMSCSLAEQYGINKRFIKPKVVSGEDSARNKIARTLAYYAGSEDTEDQPDRPNIEAGEDVDSTAREELGEPKTDIEQKPQACGDPAAMISILGEITLLITQNSDINTIFSKVLEGMYRGAGFNNTMLCLLTPDRTRYKARFAVGTNSAELKTIFESVPTGKNDLFTKVMISGEEVMISDGRSSKWKNSIKPELLDSLGVESFALSPLRWGEKPVGIFYADPGNKTPIITPEQFRMFVQLATQARLALSIKSKSK